MFKALISIPGTEAEKKKGERHRYEKGEEKRGCCLLNHSDILSTQNMDPHTPYIALDFIRKFKLPISLHTCGWENHYPSHGATQAQGAPELTWLTPKDRSCKGCRDKGGGYLPVTGFGTSSGVLLEKTSGRGPSGGVFPGGLLGRKVIVTDGSGEAT